MHLNARAVTYAGVSVLLTCLPDFSSISSAVDPNLIGLIANPIYELSRQIVSASSHRLWGQRLSCLSWLTLPMALTARVKPTAGDLVQMREVRNGGSYFFQNDLPFHFGQCSRELLDKVDL